MTGKPASAPMSPRPRIAVPFVTMTMRLPLPVYFHAVSGLAAISSQTLATPGVYTMRRSITVRSGTRATVSIAPPR